MSKVKVQITRVHGIFVRYEARSGSKMGLGFTKAGAIRDLKRELRYPKMELVEIDMPEGYWNP